MPIQQKYGPKLWIMTSLILFLTLGMLKNEAFPHKIQENEMTKNIEIQPIDFYVLIHKALRRETFNLAIHIGITDFKNKKSVETLVSRIHYLISALNHHGEHEDKYFHPFIRTKLPKAVSILDQEHKEQEMILKQIETLSNDLLKTEDDKIRLEKGNALYQIFNLFIADLLYHLDAEEKNMPLISELSTPKELEKVIEDFQANADPQILEESLNYIFPAIPQDECDSLLQNIKENAPNEVYQRVLKIYESTAADF